MEGISGIDVPEELRPVRTSPGDLEERYVLVLAAASDRYGMDFPTPTNITDEICGFFDLERVNVKNSVREIVERLEENGYLEDRLVAGSDAPYKPTEESEILLDGADGVFEYLESNQ